MVVVSNTLILNSTIAITAISETHHLAFTLIVPFIVASFLYAQPMEASAIIAKHRQILQASIWNLASVRIV